ncbi:MAG: prephenate dehydrogenase [Ruminococcaceae bacterium]|nr:prephenate dehydrogenase [Oscillospiraceae bacterium]
MTELTKDTKILIVGLGVIGGGYAKALTYSGFRHVRCITKNASDIDYAIAHGMIEFGTTELDEALIKESELIVFALYPHIFKEWVEKHGHLFSPGSIITDVTGIKSGIVYEVQALMPDGVEFISAHPMAGREKSGVEFSNAEIFRGANYIIVSTEKNTKNAINICKNLGEALGFSKISELSIKEHDQMIAFLSQLTHCIAVVLMNSNDKDGLEKYTGDSFRDLTRIAKINEVMWSELFDLNREFLLEEIDSFIDKFTEFRAMLAEGNIDGMKAEMIKATKKRELFDKPDN